MTSGLPGASIGAAAVDVTFIYLMIGLKLPIVALLTIVWWAVKQVPEEEPLPGADGGGPKVRHPRPPRPPRPRARGPHGEAAPPSPQRMRGTIVRARQLDR